MTREYAALLLERCGCHEKNLQIHEDSVQAHDAGASALRRLDELEEWVISNINEIGLCGDPWGEDLARYNAFVDVRNAIDGEIRPSKEKP